MPTAAHSRLESDDETFDRCKRDVNAPSSLSLWPSELPYRHCRIGEEGEVTRRRRLEHVKRFSETIQFNCNHKTALPSVAQTTTASSLILLPFTATLTATFDLRIELLCSQLNPGHHRRPSEAHIRYPSTSFQASAEWYGQVSGTCMMSSAIFSFSAGQVRISSVNVKTCQFSLLSLLNPASEPSIRRSG